MKVVATLEDDESLIELYQTILEDEGYTVNPVTFTKDLKQLLNNIRLTQPDMLILDAHLPGLGSYEIMQGMLADKELTELPVLICSASRPALRSLGTLMENAGSKMPVTLEKPFNLDDLSNCIIKIIGKPN